MCSLMCKKEKDGYLQNIVILIISIVRVINLDTIDAMSCENCGIFQQFNF